MKSVVLTVIIAISAGLAYGQARTMTIKLYFHTDEAASGEGDCFKVASTTRKIP